MSYEDILERLATLESLIEEQQTTIESQRERIAELERQQSSLRDNRLIADGASVKVLGELDAIDGIGVLGRATGSGQTYGVRGEASSTSGYGLSTPDDATVGGTAELGALGGSVTGGKTVSDLLGPGLSITGGSLTGTGVSTSGTTVYTGVGDINFGSELYVKDEGNGTVTVSTVPIINDFAMTNPSGPTLAVSFDASAQLTTIGVDITIPSRNRDVTTLTGSDFTESCSGNTCTYTGTVDVSKSYTYEATLTTAEDDDGDDGATGQSDTATVTSAFPRIVYNDQGTLQGLDASGIRFDYAPGSINVDAYGPGNTDITGNGHRDVPYHDSNGNLRIVDTNDNIQKLDDSGSVSRLPIGVGDWNDDGTTEIVYQRGDTSDGSEDLYSVAPGRSPTNLGFEPRAAAVADFGGDGTQEIIWINYDGSNTNLVYSNDGTTKTDTGYDMSGNLGTLADFDDDGAIEVVDIDGDITLVEDDGTTATISTSYRASSSPTGALDYTGTGVPDVIHLNEDSASTPPYDIYYYDVVNDTSGPVKDVSGTIIQTRPSSGIR